MREEWPRYYILVGRTPIAVDMMTWALWFGKNENRRVANTVIDKNVGVSTVFMGLDHNFLGRGDPILFETMIFGGPLDQEQWRYTSYDAAERGHEEAVAACRIAVAKVKAIATAAGAKENSE